MRLPRVVSRAPLAVAAVLATPLFFVSLMAASLAVERPAAVEVLRNGRLVTRLEHASSATEAKIWLLALLPSLFVLLVGFAATLVRHGLVIVPLAAIGVTVAVMQRLDEWTSRHTERFPLGADLIPVRSTSDILLRGEWERAANDTATSLGRWTIALAAAALLIVAAAAVRRRRGPVRPPPEPPPEGALDQSSLGAR